MKSFLIVTFLSGLVLGFIAGSKHITDSLKMKFFEGQAYLCTNGEK